MLASVSWAGEIRTWDITQEGPAELGNLALPDGLVAELVPSDDGEQFAASVHGDDETISVGLFDPRGERRTLVDDLRGPGNHWVRIADDLSAAAGLDGDHVAHVYDLPTGESRLTLPPCQSPRAISADGSRLVVDGRLLCINDSGVTRTPLRPTPSSAVPSSTRTPGRCCSTWRNARSTGPPSARPTHLPRPTSRCPSIGRRSSCTTWVRARSSGSSASVAI